MIDSKAAEARYSPASWSKGTRLIEKAVVVPDDTATGVFWVSPPQYTDPVRYRVQVIGEAAEDGVPWVSCTCPNGQHTGGMPRCYHSAAVLQVLLARQAGPVNPDCAQGKHTACAGDAWDDDTDALTQCGCSCHV